MQELLSTVTLTATEQWRITEDAQHRPPERVGDDGMEICYTYYVMVFGAGRLLERVAEIARHRFDYDPHTTQPRTWTITAPGQRRLELRLDGGTVGRVTDFSQRSVSLG